VWLRLKSSRGFTLLEALLSVSLIAIIAALVLPRFFSSLRETEKLSVSTQVKAIVKQAQQYAIAYNSPISLHFTRQPTANFWIIDKLNPDLTIDRSLMREEFSLKDASVTSNIEFDQIIFRPNAPISLIYQDMPLIISQNVSLFFRGASHSVTINILLYSGNVIIES
jgi:prepilin-type N-terminal cleavage/methylation domain-containing protein